MRGVVRTDVFANSCHPNISNLHTRDSRQWREISYAIIPSDQFVHFQKCHQKTTIHYRCFWMNSVIILFNLWKLHVRTKRTTKTTTLIFENLSYYTLYFPEYHNILFENSYKAKSLVTALQSSLSALFTKFYKHWQKTIKHWKCFWMNFVAICNLWKLHVKLDASVCRSFSFEKRPWKTLHFLHISTSPYLESSDKAINFTRN